MIRTVEANVDEHGNVRLLEPIPASTARSALVTILDERPAAHHAESALLSEVALGQDWDRPEEDQAWAYLQPAR